MVNDKKKGAFFTPRKLSEYLCKNVLVNIRNQNKKIRVLEPSVGHGSIVSAIDCLASECDFDIHVDGFDNERTFIDHCMTISFPNISTSFFCKDFIEVEEPVVKYDVVVGNPPYLNYKILDRECSQKCKEYFENNDIDGKNFRNLWTLFVLKAIKFLSDNGSLHFLIPKELLYVKHASWLRTMLLETFQQINLHVFDDFQFNGIEQDVVIIECYKRSKTPGFYICENGTNLDKKPHFIKKNIDQNVSNKWSQITVDEQNLFFLHKTFKLVPSVSDCCMSVAGIVTAANKFFILNKEKIDSFGVKNISRPIIKKSSDIQGDLVLDYTAFKVLEDGGKACHLLCNFDMSVPPPSIQEYLKEGEVEGLTQRYKMRRRKPWYKIPVIWESPAFFFKRVHEIPKLIYNEAQVLVTDTAYRVTPLEGFDIQSIIFSFYNSLTLVFCELRGRSYGGGVLEITPNEFKGLPLPYQKIDKDDFLSFRDRFRSMNFNDFIVEQDARILPQIGLKEREIRNIQEIRKSLILKRTKGK